MPTRDNGTSRPRDDGDSATAIESAVDRNGRGEDRRWLNYQQAAAYCGWSVGHLRNLVSAGQVPVFGKSRVRRFHREWLDAYLQGCRMRTRDDGASRPLDAADGTTAINSAIDLSGRGENRRWLNYQQAAAYCGWSVGHLRNLVSAGQVPVFGKTRVRRFHREWLDAYLRDPDLTLRRFRAERNRHGS